MSAMFREASTSGWGKPLVSNVGGRGDGDLGGRRINGGGVNKPFDWGRANQTERKMNMRRYAQKISAALNFGMEKYIPDSFLFAVLLVFIVFLMGIFVAGKGPLDMVNYFSQNIWNFLTFSMQMVLIIVTGFVVSTSPLGKRFFAAMARIPQTSFQAVLLVSTLAAVISYFHWGVGMIGGALLATEMGRVMKRLDFKILIASVYVGYTVGSVGFSGSEILIINTPGHFLEKQIGLIPATQTALSMMNLVPIITTTFIVLPVLWWLLHPAEEKDIPVVGDETTAYLSKELAAGKDEAATGGTTFAEKVENCPAFNILLGLMMAVYLGQWLYANGLFNMNLNIFNLLMLTIGILLHWTPKSFYTSFAEGVRISWGIPLQFPIYAGIQGMMATSGLAAITAGWFIDLATTWSFPLWNYVLGAFVNFFIPSSGGILIVLGPVVVKAGQALWVSNPTIISSFMFGEALGNIIQPFWAIPILAIAGLRLRDIYGYCILAFLIITVVFLISMSFITA
jgi:short-chain fatty acids transporter